MNRRVVELKDTPLDIDAVLDIVRDRAVLRLSSAPDFKEMIHRGAQALAQTWENGRAVYGVNTGFGESCVRRIPADLIPEVSRQLTRFHGCGLGRYFDEDAACAILVVRLVSLARGYSGVRYALLEALARLIRLRILPLIPEEGSVGASGDLTPLSYVAAVLMGERRVLFHGEVRNAGDALQECGMAPFGLNPKEGLALMNGTSVMTALACLAYDRARYLVGLSARLTAMMTISLLGNKAHFDRRIFLQKPHPGQAAVAGVIAEELDRTCDYPRPSHVPLQDPYSIRCAPHVIGVLADALPWMKGQIETELNSANDNPLIDPHTGDVLHGGNFYGGHMAFVMDAMKIAVANIADLADRQMALLVDAHHNRGLSRNLSGASPERLPINHAFKAVQIGCSAWAAEALKQTMPASVHSRSTESHNQDKVSMGTIAARDCLRVIELTEQVLAACMLAAVQALDLRFRQGEMQLDGLSRGIQDIYHAVRGHSPFVQEDRPLDKDLRDLLRSFRNKELHASWDVP